MINKCARFTIKQLFQFKKLLKPLCILSVSWGASAESNILKESDFLSELPTLTSASRLKQNTHTSPASVTVIDQTLIKASGAQTLPEVLALAPGFQILHLNRNRQTVSYHSVSNQFPNQLEIMINGRSVYLPLLSTVLWNTLGIHVDDIERVEIVRGSNSATQGSNAFLGAVNFITKSPLTDAQWKGIASLGSRNTSEGHLTYAGSLDGGFYRISGSTARNDGSKKFNDSHERQYLNLHGLLTPTTWDTLNLAIGFDKGYSHIGYLYQYGNFPPSNYYLAKQKYSSNFQKISWSRELSRSQELHIQAYRNSLRLNENKPSTNDLATYYLGTENTDLAQSLLSLNPEFRGYREHGSTDLWDLEVALENQTGIHSSFSGIGFRKDKASSPVLFQSGQVSSKRVRLFNSSEIKLNPHWIVNLGLMHERQNSDLNATSARLALNYQITEETSLRLGYSRSQRLPSLLERHVNYEVIGRGKIEQANLALKAETIKNVELGIHHQFRQSNGSIDLRVFKESVNNAIMNYRVATPLNEEFGQRRNIGYWRNLGIESQFKIIPSDQLWLALNYSLVNNKVGSWKTGDDNQRFDGGQLAPRHTLSVISNYAATPDITISGAYYFMDNARWIRGNRFQSQSASQRLDIRVAREWRAKDSTIELSALLQNALPGSHSTFYQDNKFDRRALLQLAIAID